MKSYASMTAKELEAEKRRLYQEAKDNGKLANCELVCRWLGKSLNTLYGPKYQYKDGDLELYVDQYGGYQTARFGDKTVMSTHFCEQKFIPGPWFDMVSALVDSAKSLRDSHERQRAESKRNKLLAELSA